MTLILRDATPSNAADMLRIALSFAAEFPLATRGVGIRRCVAYVGPGVVDVAYWTPGGKVVVRREAAP